MRSPATPHTACAATGRSFAGAHSLARVQGHPTTHRAPERRVRRRRRRRGGRWPCRVDTREQHTIAALTSPPAASSADAAASVEAPGGGDDDSSGSIAQLDVGRPHVDHQVAERLAEADHRDGRDDVEHDLLGGAGLQPGRAGDDLRSADELDRMVDEAGSARRPDWTRCRPSARRRCVPWRTAPMVYGVRPDAAMPTTASSAQTPSAARSAAPAAASSSARFAGSFEGRRASGHHTDDAVGVERGRALGGVEHAHPAGGPGAGVDQPAAAAQPVDDGVDRRGDAVRRWR